MVPPDITSAIWVIAVADDRPDTAKGHCPTCGALRTSSIRASYKEDWSDEHAPVYGSTKFMVLQCCGCEDLFIRKDVHFSEDDDYDYGPNGEVIGIPGVTTTYWPAPSARQRPQWSGLLDISDTILLRILDELYAALDADLRVLASIGIRTAFDRASELLGVNHRLIFKNKLNALVDAGKIGTDERSALDAIVDAGGAAAHRGWRPEPKDISTMMDILEAFLYRSIVIGHSLKKLQRSIPPRA